MKAKFISKAGSALDAMVLLSDSSPPAGHRATVPAAFDRPVAARRSLPPRSSTDFIRAVRALAAVLAAKGRPSEPPQREVQKVWTTYVGCSLEIWERTFGETKGLVPLKLDSMSRPIHLWQHLCNDGLVTCIGHRFDDPPEGQRVLVVRLCCP